MTAIKFLPMATDEARALQRGGKDAYGQTPEKWTSDGGGAPCRHCLTDVAEGDDFLVLAHQPFPKSQPYAETGPIFLHAKECGSYQDTGRAPKLFDRSKTLLVRGYDEKDQICYWAAEHVPVPELTARCEDMLADPRVRYLHIRSTSYNCYQCRVERA